MWQGRACDDEENCTSMLGPTLNSFQDPGVNACSSAFVPTRSHECFSLLCVCVSKGNTVKVSPSSRTRSLLRRDDRDGIAQTVERATNRKEPRETPQLGGHPIMS